MFLQTKDFVLIYTSYIQVVRVRVKIYPLGGSIVQSEQIEQITFSPGEGDSTHQGER